MDAIRMEIEMVISIRIAIRDDFKISGEVTDLKTKIKEFKPFFNTDTNMKGLSA